MSKRLLPIDSVKTVCQKCIHYSFVPFSDWQFRCAKAKPTLADPVTGEVAMQSNYEKNKGNCEDYSPRMRETP